MRKLFLYFTPLNNTKNISGFKYFIRYKLLRFILSPLIMYGYKMDKKEFVNTLIYSFYYNPKIKEWLSKYKFHLNKFNALYKVDIISQNNIMFHDTDSENKLKIIKDFSIALNSILRETDFENFFSKQMKFEVNVTTEYKSEMDLLKNIYDKKLYDETINDMVLKRGFETKEDLLIDLSYGKEDIKVIMYSIVMYYKYTNEYDKLKKNNTILICLITLIVIVLTIIFKIK